MVKAAASLVGVLFVELVFVGAASLLAPLVSDQEIVINNGPTILVAAVLVLLAGAYVHWRAKQSDNGEGASQA